MMTTTDRTTEQHLTIASLLSDMIDAAQMSTASLAMVRGWIARRDYAAITSEWDGMPRDIVTALYGTDDISGFTFGEVLLDVLA